MRLGRAFRHLSREERNGAGYYYKVGERLFLFQRIPDDNGVVHKRAEWRIVEDLGHDFRDEPMQFKFLAVAKEYFRKKYLEKIQIQEME